MSRTVEEHTSKDMLVKLIGMMDRVEENNEERKLSEPDLGSKCHYSDHPEDLYDEDLLEIQSMNLEPVEEKLATLGYDKAFLDQSLEITRDGNVIPLPLPKQTVEEAKEYKLNENIIFSIFKEASLKSMMSKSNKNREDLKENSQLAIRKTTPSPRKNKYARNLTLALSLIACTTIGFASVTPFILERIDNILTEHRALNTPAQGIFSTTGDASLSIEKLKLDYKNSLLLLEKIEKNEGNYTVEEQHALLDRMYEMAQSDKNILEKINAQNSKQACIESNLYKHIVEAGDTISTIVNGCAYKVRQDLSKITEVLNVGDIVLVKVNKNLEVIRLDIDKNQNNGIKNIF